MITAYDGADLVVGVAGMVDLVGDLPDAVCRWLGEAQCLRRLEHATVGTDGSGSPDEVVHVWKPLEQGDLAGIQLLEQVDDDGSQVRRRGLGRRVAQVEDVVQGRLGGQDDPAVHGHQRVLQLTRGGHRVEGGVVELAQLTVGADQGRDGGGMFRDLGEQARVICELPSPGACQEGTGQGSATLRREDRGRDQLGQPVDGEQGETHDALGAGRCKTLRQAPTGRRTGDVVGDDDGHRPQQVALLQSCHGARERVERRGAVRHPGYGRPGHSGPPGRRAAHPVRGRGGVVRLDKNQHQSPSVLPTTSAVIVGRVSA